LHKKYNDIDLFSDKFNQHSKILSQDAAKVEKGKLEEEGIIDITVATSAKLNKSIDFDLNSLENEAGITTERVIDVVLPQMRKPNV